MATPIISVVLGSYNRLNFLKSAITSIRQNGIIIPYEIIVIDGGSTDGSITWLVTQKDIMTIVQHNRGEWQGSPIEMRSWGYFMNIAFRATHGKYILMISDDSLLVPGAVMNGYNHFENLLDNGRRVGAMAFYWRNWLGSKRYWVGKTFGKLFVNHGLYLREVVSKLNGFDEETYYFYHADGDLCLRMWEKGYEVVDCPDAYVEHFSHANMRVRKSNAEKQEADWRIYSKRWEHLQYNPNDARILRSYTDPHHTFRNFPWTARAWMLFKKYAKPFLQKFRDLRT